MTTYIALLNMLIVTEVVATLLIEAPLTISSSLIKEYLITLLSSSLLLLFHQLKLSTTLCHLQ